MPDFDDGECPCAERELAELRAENELLRERVKELEVTLPLVKYLTDKADELLTERDEAQAKLALVTRLAKEWANAPSTHDWDWALRFCASMLTKVLSPDEKCAAVAYNGHRCLLDAPHDGPHCTHSDGGWYDWPEAEHSALLKRAQADELSDDSTAQPPGAPMVCTVCNRARGIVIDPNGWVICPACRGSGRTAAPEPPIVHAYFSLERLRGSRAAAAEPLSGDTRTPEQRKTGKLCPVCRIAHAWEHPPSATPEPETRESPAKRVLRLAITMPAADIAYNEQLPIEYVRGVVDGWREGEARAEKAEGLVDKFLEGFGSCINEGEQGVEDALAWLKVQTDARKRAESVRDALEITIDGMRNERDELVKRLEKLEGEK